MRILRVLLIKIIIFTFKCTCHRHFEFGSDIDPNVTTRNFIKKYKSISKSSFSHPNTKIAGGEFASIKEYPHSVLFTNYGGICAGTILSDKLVLTSAHCLDHNKKKSEMTVFAGARYLFDRLADVYKIQNFIIHDRYNRPIRFANDAALLIIHSEIVFKPTVRKALLINNRDWMKPGTIITVTGWGETKPGSETGSEKGFQKADLTLLSPNECRNSAGTIVTTDMFCLWGNRTRATCRGDSGGGALWRDMVVGIISHGGICTKLPGVYTNVYYLREWIEKTCKKLYLKYCNFYFPYFGDY